LYRPLFGHDDLLRRANINGFRKVAKTFSIDSFWFLSFFFLIHQGRDLSEIFPSLYIPRQETHFLKLSPVKIQRWVSTVFNMFPLIRLEATILLLL